MNPNTKTTLWGTVASLAAAVKLAFPTGSIAAWVADGMFILATFMLGKTAAGVK
jgi:hypothetical protein